MKTEIHHRKIKADVAYTFAQSSTILPELPDFISSIASRNSV
jgi:hypothetical protein